MVGDTVTASNATTVSRVAAKIWVVEISFSGNSACDTVWQGGVVAVLDARVRELEKVAKRTFAAGVYLAERYGRRERTARGSSKEHAL